MGAKSTLHDNLELVTENKYLLLMLDVGGFVDLSMVCWS